jgi:hypothetical protein
MAEICVPSLLKGLLLNKKYVNISLWTCEKIFYFLLESQPSIIDLIMVVEILLIHKFGTLVAINLWNYISLTTELSKVKLKGTN